jgi:hypothetical protein
MQMFKKSMKCGRPIFDPEGEISRSALRNCRAFCRGIMISALILVAACRTVHPLPPVNFSEPGWTVRQGQVVWRSRTEAPEIAGEILVATRPDHSSFVQFTKTPLPFMVAQTTPDSWQIHSVPDDRTYAGGGKPPGRIIWLQLPACLAGLPPPEPWRWETSSDNHWHLYNPRTGESLEGYLSP